MAKLLMCSQKASQLNKVKAHDLGEQHLGGPLGGLGQEDETCLWLQIPSSLRTVSTGWQLSRLCAGLSGTSGECRDWVIPSLLCAVTVTARMQSCIDFLTAQV